jgi:hypothetical protein
MNRLARLGHSASRSLSVALLGLAASACTAPTEPAAQEETGRATQDLDRSGFACAPSTPRTAAGYDAPWAVEGFRPGRLPGFSDELTAAGCAPELVYHLGPSAVGDVAVAFCPSVPSDLANVVTVIPPDACVGTPPPGWLVVTWSDRPMAIPPPPAGCGLFACFEI